ncbi:uncharacterized protein LOC133200471 [Saccostrea echinata]|uniref:uncharacterized protein LOC133200471 n=1 Tax=Saccostrea echinata TaxID=191078 RepID=UPI002A7ED159|nr:uncharacterized protein LOC133200471 [Saccostrea echinata]
MPACPSAGIILVLLLYLQTLAAKGITPEPQRCDGKNKCCFGYTWDEELQDCIKCSIGYFDVYCNRTCPYPYYGIDCDEKCQCEQQTCNFITGCLDNASDIHSATNQSSTDSHDFSTTATSSSTESKLSLKSVQSSSLVNQIISFSLRDFLLFIAGVLVVFTLFTAFNVLICKWRSRGNYAIFNKNEQKCALIESKDTVRTVCRGNTKIIISHCTENNSCFLEISTNKDNRKNKDNCYSNSDVDKEENEKNKKDDSIVDHTALHLCTIKPQGREETFCNSSQCSQCEDDCDTDVKELSDSNQFSTTSKVPYENEYISVSCGPEYES